ncbi:hypothetical protein V8G54_015531 [Vigna mungo]|uniref:BSD domain-containing protein n=1 Tax=Vigna mungo TaxID=3915 RepID=A0AAQ3NLE0_VIGMU
MQKASNQPSIFTRLEVTLIHHINDKMALQGTWQEISRLRYELCPRVMKERKFWRIYFILVNNHTAPYDIGSYENKYMEDEKLKSSEQGKDRIVTMKPLNAELICNQEAQEMPKKDNLSTSTEQDLDVFLLGEGNSDDEPAYTTMLSGVGVISNDSIRLLFWVFELEYRITCALGEFKIGDFTFAYNLSGLSDDGDGRYNDDLDKLMDNSDDEKGK